MTRFDPRVHKLCTTPGCTALERRHYIKVFGIEKDICTRCYDRWYSVKLSCKSLDFLLTDEDRAELAAKELAQEDDVDLITAEDIANTMPPKPWEA